MDELNFEIRTSPILYGRQDDLKISGNYQAIYRNDNDKLLSVMSSSYNPLKVSDFKAITDKMSSISGFENVGNSVFKDGRIILSHLKNNNPGLQINGNAIENYMIVGSSFDGSYPIFIGTSNILIRCTNAFGQISKHNKIRHTKSSDVKVEELIQSMDVYFQEQADLQYTFEEWGSIDINKDLINLAVNNFLGMSDDDSENSTTKKNKSEILKSCIVRETRDLGENLWGLLNGFTYYSTHKMNNKNPSFGSIVGPAASFNEKAFKIVESINL